MTEDEQLTRLYTALCRIALALGKISDKVEQPGILETITDLLEGSGGSEET